ncbi:DUF4384 domain-containing protein [Lacinutrix sp. C3R15]|uniref:C1 family peptidase n=1 Tax=Flavobacteriaceae TaxID=49546 RepID=UPI001C09E47A|nr:MULTISPECIES: C1 family peptidase [Flavobacteriaceae]MBU2938375.1 DUF4384 domain-containing protein [Lacinutrix sp. C3R15]MDO6621690.1 C1 family peptidase [Oceanihabitans sp. 1_MG-2023]
MKKNLTILFLFFITISISAQNKPKTGLLFDDASYNKTPMKARNVAFQDVISEQTSSSLKEFVPEIKNQGGYGTCVGWSSAYYGRTILNARRNDLITKEDINQNTYSPVFTYLNSNIDDDYNCQGGAYINRALKVMVEVGTPLFNDYDVMCDSSVPDELLSKAKENKIKDFTRLYSGDESNETKIESVKRSLVNGNPVIIGFMVENAFYTAKNVFEPAYTETTGGHAMCVIGYDDEKYGGSFEIVNSWGEQWGNNGFIWVRYEDFANLTKYAFEMIPQKKPIKQEKNVLSGELDLELFDGSTMDINLGSGDYKKSVLGWQEVVVEDDVQSIGDYTTKEIYPSGTKYRMYAKVNKPSYVYVLGADSEGQNGILFPHKQDVSPYINYENTSVVIPGERHWFRLNGDIDSDYSIVIFSLDKIDMDDVKNKLDTMEGNILDKLYVIFNDKLINKEDITLSEEKIGFTSEFTEGSIALMILDIKRR